jgi:hypothetical protein
MTKAPYYQTLARPQVFVWRMFLFVVLAGLIAFIIHEPLVQAFVHNPVLNALILGVLIFGILYTFQQVLRLYPEIRWVNSFRIESGFSDRYPVMLAPMATLFQRRQGQGAISPTAMRSLLDSIGSRLDESREITRYLVGLLVFLGLLGTFWGLLTTVSSVGGVIDSMKVTEGGDFETLKNGLSKPLKGMGTAFSASLFGLAGSLIVGFLDLQAGQAQNRFYNDLEEWLSDFTELSPEGMTQQGGQPAQFRYAMLDMQRSLADVAEKIEVSMMRNNSSEAMLELSRGIDRLIKQMRGEQQAIREWLDEQGQRHQTELANVLREQSRLTNTLHDLAGRLSRERR